MNTHKANEILAKMQDRPREEWDNITPAQAALEAKALASELTRHGTRAQTRRKRTAKASPAKPTKFKSLKAVHKDSVHDLIEAGAKRRAAKKLQRAKDTGKRIAFRGELNAAGKALEASQAQADAEADASESKVLGTRSTGTKASGTPASIYAEYLGMEQGEERRAYLSKNKFQIEQAMNSQKG